MIIKKIKKNKGGFVLLYVVIISSIILAITLSIANISLREIKFGTSAKDTNDAFFAADTGAECALYGDKGFGVNDSFPSSIICNGESVTVNPTGAFTLLGLGSSGKSCAKVTISKDPFALPNPLTTVISKGYNIGGDDSCNSTDPNRVERQLELNY